MEYDDGIEEFDELSKERVVELKEDVEAALSELQKTALMLSTLLDMHEEREQLRSVMANNTTRDMEMVLLVDSKKRRAIEDALEKYNSSERKETEHKLRLLNDDLSVMDQDVRETIRKSVFANTFL